MGCDLAATFLAVRVWGSCQSLSSKTAAALRALVIQTCVLVD